MAFRRKLVRRPRRFRKKSTAIVPRIKKYVKRQINRNIETKYVVNQFNPAYVDVFGHFYTLNTIQQGLTDGERIGDSINFKRCFFKYTIVRAATESYNFVRVIIFQYKQNNTVAPSTTTILNGSNPTYLSQYNYDNRFNYAILYDKIHSVNNDRPAITVRSRTFNKWAKKKIQFANGTSTQGTNHMYVFVISDSTIPQGPQITGHFVFQYTDA